MGSSKARFKEAAKRNGIHHQMDLLQRKIENRQKYLWDNFQVRTRRRYSSSANSHDSGSTLDHERFSNLFLFLGRPYLRGSRLSGEDAVG